MASGQEIPQKAKCPCHYPFSFRCDSPFLGPYLRVPYICIYIYVYIYIYRAFTVVLSCVILCTNRFRINVGQFCVNVPHTF